jgi:hypothetical protein
VHFGLIVKELVTKRAKDADLAQLQRRIEQEIARLDRTVYPTLRLELDGYQAGAARCKDEGSAHPALARHRIPGPDPQSAQAKSLDDYCSGSALEILKIDVGTISPDEARWAHEKVVSLLAPAVRKQCRRGNALAMWMALAMRS